jgi:hypothetical protein
MTAEDSDWTPEDRQDYVDVVQEDVRLLYNVRRRVDLNLKQTDIPRIETGTLNHATHWSRGHCSITEPLATLHFDDLTRRLTTH